MAAQVVAIKLAQPYSVRPNEMDTITRQGLTLEQWQRNMSEQFIMLAVQSVHGAELDRKDGRMFSRIKRQLDKETAEIELDGTQADWLFECFTGTKAEQAKIRPELTVWYFQWLDYVEELRASVKAQDA